MDQKVKLPILRMSSAKLCKFRKYTLELVVAREDRIKAGLTESAVFAAVLHAKCCRSGTTTVANCAKCRCQPVVTLTSATQWARHDGADNEVYACIVQSKCSSSRDHLKSPLVLRVDTIPTLGVLETEPFVLLARDKGKNKNRRDQSLDAVAAAVAAPEKRPRTDTAAPAAPAESTLLQQQQQQQAQIQTQAQIQQGQQQVSPPNTGRRRVDNALASLAMLAELEGMERQDEQEQSEAKQVA